MDLLSQRYTHLNLDTCCAQGLLWFRAYENAHFLGHLLVFGIGDILNLCRCPDGLSHVALSSAHVLMASGYPSSDGRDLWNFPYRPSYLTSPFRFLVGIVNLNPSISPYPQICLTCSLLFTINGYYILLVAQVENVMPSWFIFQTSISSNPLWPRSPSHYPPSPGLLESSANVCSAFREV